MNGNTYQDATATTEIYTDVANDFIDQIINAEDGISAYGYGDILKIMYCTGKLNGEAGELAELVFKAFRGGLGITDDVKDKAFYELGDIMWYVARIADLCGYRLDDIMHANLEKLKDRKDRGVLHGYGDKR